MGFTGVVWASRDLRRLAHDLVNGAGAGPMGEAGETWAQVARELADIAKDYRALLAKLDESWRSAQSDTVHAKLEEFGKWLDAVALDAAANARHAESAAVAHAVAVLAMPTVPEAQKLQEALAIGSSLQGYPNGLVVGALGAGDAAVQAATANAVAIMNSYEHTATPLAQPWDTQSSPNIAKSAAQRAAGKGDAPQGAGAGAPAGGLGSGAGGGVGGGVPAAPLGVFGTQTVKSDTSQRGSRVVAASANPSGATTSGPMGPMGAMGRGGGDDKEFDSTRPAASLSDAGEVRPVSWSPAVASSGGGFSVDSVSWGPDASTFGGTAAPPVSDDDLDIDGTRLEQTASNDWVSPSVIGERGGRG
ncbi:PPE domain-containing protein [Gordonia sp. DT30]|uniref:PPE domain-containing protein n=1 Tax=unclassified Gordonia (in: high G+C Gram-positive bacteria) TaxID=2657482 RepID=UPI003CF84449